MDQNNHRNIASLQEILTNSNFAQFLSEHLPNNNITQSEISNLLNIFSRQLNNQQHQNNNNNENQLLGESIISQISHVNNNNYSIISDSNILSDIADELIVNNGAAPGINNFSTKEYENGIYQGTLIDNKREGQGIMKYNSGDIYEGNIKMIKKMEKVLIYL